jgi:KDO2-lipid IV(A) lauroyltransferase
VSSTAPHPPAVIKRGPGRLLFRSIFGAIGRSPEPRALLVSKLVNPLVTLPTRRLRGTNLQLLFPGRTSIERAILEKRHLQYLALMRVHIARAAHFSREEALRTAQVNGQEHLQAALEKGRGVLLVGGHVGTWWHCPGMLAVFGYRVSIVVNSDLFPPMVEHMHRLSDRYGFRIAYTSQNAYQQAKEAFARNEIFSVTMDYSIRPERSLRLPFFGAALPVDPGTAMLALRQRAEVLWVNCHHDAQGRSIVSLTPEQPLGRGTPLASSEQLSRHWVARLQSDLEPHPEQWWPMGFLSLDPPDRIDSTP